MKVFRERMRVSPSQADKAVRIELQNRGRADELLFDKILFLSGPNRGKIFNKEKVTKDMMHHNGERVRWTNPESIGGMRVFYLDGPPHRQRGVKNRDDRIDDELRRLGFKPTRFSYSPPLSLHRKHDICNQIVAFLEAESR